MFHAVIHSSRLVTQKDTKSILDLDFVAQYQQKPFNRYFYAAFYRKYRNILFVFSFA